MSDDDQNLQVEAEVTVPDWVPEKFRGNPEKFGEAYENLEREFHQTRRDLKAQQEQVEALVVAQQAQPEPQTNQDQLYAAYENDPVATMAWLAQQAAAEAVKTFQPQIQQTTQPLAQSQNELLAYTVDQMVSQRVPDWADHKQKVADFVSARPYLLPETTLASPATTADALEAAYKAMRYDELQNSSTSRAEEAQAEIERLKRQAQTLQGHPGRPAATDADNDYWQKIVNAPSGGL